MSNRTCRAACEGGHPFSLAFEVPQALGVVPRYVGIDRLPERPEVPVLGLVPVEHLALHRPEEGLHDGVVEAVPLPRHRLTDPAAFQLLDVPTLLVLPALVGMEYEARQVRVGEEGRLQHPPCLGGIRPQAQVVGDYLAGEHVLDRAEVALPPGEGELAHVGRPFPVRAVAREIALVVGLPVLPDVFLDDEVRGHVADRALVGVVVDGFDDASEAHLPHEALHLLVVDGDPLGSELRADAPHAVPALRRVEYRRDQLGGFRVLRVEVRFPPFVEIGGLRQLGDGQKIAYFGAFRLFLRLEDGLVPLPWGRPSDATKALKFFK